MRREIESPLSSYKNAESFLEMPLVEKMESEIPTENFRPASGHNFNHYEIIKQIGAGMGEVYLAKDKKLDRRVAIKILNQNFAGHKSFPAFSPDGKHIAFVSIADGNAEIYLMNADGTGLFRLTRSKTEEIAPQFSADGKKLIFAANRNGKFAIYEIELP
jgi:serine/threonine protein kinase